MGDLPGRLYGRSVSEVAGDLGCGWHTANNAVVAYGARLIDDPARIGQVDALRLDEALFVKRGRWREKQWSTSMVDIRTGKLLDIVEGRDSGPCLWLADRDPSWRARIRYGTLDMSEPCRKVYDTMLPDAIQVADSFYLCKFADEKLDEVRRRVNQELLGHRGHKDDPLYRAGKLLVMANERLDKRCEGKLTGLLKAGDPYVEVTTAQQAREALRERYSHRDPELALEWVDQLSTDMRDISRPRPVSSAVRGAGAGPRSPRGTRPGTATDRPRACTVWRSGSSESFPG